MHALFPVDLALDIGLDVNTMPDPESVLTTLRLFSKQQINKLNDW